jgi:hypothetical protein
MNRGVFGLVLSLAIIIVFAGPASAALEATVSAELRSARAEAKFASCGRQFRGQEAVNCVSTAVGAFAADVGSCGYIAAVAPRAGPTVAAAANEIRGAKTKQAAISVLNRVRSVLGGLAAQSSGEARSVYSRINRAFQTAISVINSKG